MMTMSPERGRIRAVGVSLSLCAWLCIVTGCGDDAGRQSENYGNLLASPGGLVVLEEEHPTGWTRPDCYGCHDINNIHQVNRTGLPDDEVDLPGIRAIVRNEGEESCAMCHGSNGTHDSRDCWLARHVARPGALRGARRGLGLAPSHDESPTASSTWRPAALPQRGHVAAALELETCTLVPRPGRAGAPTSSTRRSRRGEAVVGRAGGRCPGPAAHRGRQIYCGTCHLFHDPKVMSENWLKEGWLPPERGVSGAVRQSVIDRWAVLAAASNQKGPLGEFATEGTRQLRMPIDGGQLCRHCHKAPR